MQSVGIYETNRAGAKQAPRETELGTVSGGAVSMATVQQATMPYAIDAIKAHAELRAYCLPP